MNAQADAHGKARVGSTPKWDGSLTTLAGRRAAWFDSTVGHAGDQHRPPFTNYTGERYAEAKVSNHRHQD